MLTDGRTNGRKTGSLYHAMPQAGTTQKVQVITNENDNNQEGHKDHDLNFSPGLIKTASSDSDCANLCIFSRYMYLVKVVYESDTVHNFLYFFV